MIDKEPMMGLVKARTGVDLADLKWYKSTEGCLYSLRDYGLVSIPFIFK